MPRSDYSLYDSSGHRKYLTEEEVTRYVKAIEPALSRRDIDEERKSLALLLAATGCRLGEALTVRYRDIELVTVSHPDGQEEDGVDITFNTLKRRKQHHRVVTAGHKMRSMLMGHNRLTNRKSETPDALIWGISKPTAFRTVQLVMQEAGITGSYANARGLRHAYIVRNVLKGIPPYDIARWAGWSSIAMLQIYADLQGNERRALALSAGL